MSMGWQCREITNGRYSMKKCLIALGLLAACMAVAGKIEWSTPDSLAAWAKQTHGLKS